MNVQPHQVTLTTIKHPVTGTECKFTQVDRLRHKANKAQRKAFKKNLRTPYQHPKDDVINAGAAKILGFVSSHIYASKPE